MKLRRLTIGMKFAGHDSAIFVIIPEKKELFGIATERVTRYKHDYLPIIPALERFIKHYDLDTSSIEELIVQKSSTYEIERASRQMGMNSMKDDAFLKVIGGVTSINEVMRVIL